MDKSEIRRLLVSHREVLSELSLTDKEYKILKIINVIPLSSHQLSEVFHISLQNASSTLKTLYNKGYLHRKELPDPTGGIYYQYFLSSELRGVIFK